MSGSEYAPPSGSGGVVWRNTRCVSSSKLHAYRDGKAICGSPLAPGAGVVIHEIPPLIIGCKKCRELCQNAGTEARVPPSPPVTVGRPNGGGK